MQRSSTRLGAITGVLCGVVLLGARPSPGAAQGAASAAAWPAPLIDSLRRLGRDDQRGRAALGQAIAAQETATVARAASADSARSVWLRRTVRARGWPTRTAVGADAATAAWLVLQHSPMYDWQREMLPTLARLAAHGELPRPDLALLTDRVLVHRGEPQRYGSQFDLVGERLVPARIADVTNLDARRAAAGLPPMVEYARMLGALYKLPVAWPPARYRTVPPR